MHLEISACPEGKKNPTVMVDPPNSHICKCHMNNVLHMDNLKNDSSVVIGCHTVMPKFSI